MCEYTQRQVCLMNQMRKLWEQHVYWTRFFIISTAADLGDRAGYKTIARKSG